MDRWPEVTEPLLRERQAMTDDAFLVFLQELLEAIGTRELTDEHYETAIGYPWERPPGSCLVIGERVEPIGEEPSAEHARRIGEYLADETRIPLLAYGSNASPGRLALKLAHRPPGDQEALVLAGFLHDFDIGVAAQPPMFSSMPATPIPSPGTKVRVAVLLLTPAQLTTLWWTEVSYKIGALDPVTLDAPLLDAPLTRLIAFVSRYGAFCVDGEPVAMKAIPAEGRRHRALTQLELLGEGARLALGEGATPRDLIKSAYENPAAFMRDRYEAFRAVSQPFRSERWEELPVG